MVAHIGILSTWQAEAADVTQAEGQPGLLNEYQDSHGCIKTTNQKTYTPKKSIIHRDIKHKSAHIINHTSFPRHHYHME